MRAEEFIFETPIFLTREFASAVGMRVDAASRKLKKIAEQGFIAPLTRGVWVNNKNKFYSAYGLTPYLLGAEQGYVSFLSALHRHGVISQIPQRIFVATTGRRRKLNSELAPFEFIQMSPHYMQQGINWFSGEVSYGMATAEKALLDCLYIGTRKGKKFRNFPELDLSSIRKNKFNQLVKIHEFPEAIESNIIERFEKL